MVFIMLSKTFKKRYLISSIRKLGAEHDKSTDWQTDRLGAGTGKMDAFMNDQIS